VDHSSSAFVLIRNSSISQYKRRIPPSHQPVRETCSRNRCMVGPDISIPRMRLMSPKYPQSWSRSLVLLFSYTLSVWSSMYSTCKEVNDHCHGFSNYIIVTCRNGISHVCCFDVNDHCHGFRHLYHSHLQEWNITCMLL